MISPRFLVPFLLMATFSSVKAVETITTTNSYYNTTNNISSSIPTWTQANSWGTGNTNTGWNYVGYVNGSGAEASGVYLGNGWVITAGHVGVGDFSLNGNTYDTTGLSYSNFTNINTGSSNADLTLFQISTTSITGTNLSLSNLTIASNAPSLNRTVVMIGYGPGDGESWGTNYIAQTNTIVDVNNAFQSIDFITEGGSNSPSTTYGTLVGGDSGGGDFVKVSSTWDLEGLNEATESIGSTNYSFFVQLSSYKSQIVADMSAVPEPSTWGLLSLGMLTIGVILRKKRRTRISQG